MVGDELGRVHNSLAIESSSNSLSSKSIMFLVVENIGSGMVCLILAIGLKLESNPFKA